MMAVMVKKVHLDRIEVPEDYEVLDATALGRRLGFKRDTVLAYLSRRNFRRIPRPNRLLLLWALSGTRRASRSGKLKRIGRVASVRPAGAGFGDLEGGVAVNAPM